MSKELTIQELKENKKAHLRTIREKGEMTPKDLSILCNYDYKVFMRRHPKFKQVTDWLYPKKNSENNWKTVLKENIKRLAVLPVTMGCNISLRIAGKYWQNKNIDHAPNKENKKQLRRMKLASVLMSMGLNSSADLVCEVSKIPSPRIKMDETLKNALRGIDSKDAPKKKVTPTTLDKSKITINCRS